MSVVQTGRAERRRHKRFGKHVITLELDGQFYSTMDWSLGGFSVDGYQGSLQPGNLVPVTIVLETGHQTYEQKVRACIVRNDDNGQKLAAKFNELGSETIDLLDGWQTGRLQRLAAKKSAQPTILTTATVCVASRRPPRQALAVEQYELEIINCRHAGGEQKCRPKG